MDLIITEVDNKQDLKKFIHLPAKIHKNHENWIPPIYMDDWQFFDAKKNPAFSHSDTIILLAWQNDRVMGRIMGIINHKYNQAHNLKEGRFCFLETFHDFDVAWTLLKEVERWAESRGMNKVVGPLAFSDKDPQGFLIEGYDKPVVIATSCNYPFMIDFMEKAGYLKMLDLLAYRVEVPESIPLFYQEIFQRAIRKQYLKVIHFSSRKQMRPYIRPVLNLVNRTFTDIYAFAHLDEKEMDDFANRYLFLLDPRFLKVIENDKREVIAFALGMPDISRGIKKSGGYIFPFGLFHIIRAKKTTRQLNMLMGAIRSDYRNAGLDTILGVELLTEARKAGFKVIDSHLELETNKKMRSEMEKLGGVPYKRFRIFQKALNPHQPLISKSVESELRL